MAEPQGIEIAVLEKRVGDLEKRQDKLEETQGKQWGRLDQQDRELVRLQVLMETVNKTIGDVGTQLVSLQKSIQTEETKRNRDWREFLDKFFWLVVGGLAWYAFGGMLHH